LLKKELINLQQRMESVVKEKENQHKIIEFEQSKLKIELEK
jgi:hypothetical protein